MKPVQAVFGITAPPPEAPYFDIDDWEGWTHNNMEHEVRRLVAEENVEAVVRLVHAVLRRQQGATMQYRMLLKQLR